MGLFLSIIPKSSVLVRKRKECGTQRDTGKQGNDIGRAEAQQGTKQHWHGQQQEGQKEKNLSLTMPGRAYPINGVTVDFDLQNCEPTYFCGFIPPGLGKLVIKILDMDTNFCFISFPLLFTPMAKLQPRVAPVALSTAMMDSQRTSLVLY